jgi:hypothetical protein
MKKYVKPLFVKTSFISSESLATVDDNGNQFATEPEYWVDGNVYFWKDPGNYGSKCVCDKPLCECPSLC